MVGGGKEIIKFPLEIPLSLSEKIRLNGGFMTHEVKISGKVKVGGRIFEGDAITHNGVPVGKDKGIDISNAPNELRLGMKLGNSITNKEVTYVFVKQDRQTGEYIYRKSAIKPSETIHDSATTSSEPEIGSEKWLQQLNKTIEKASAAEEAKEKVGLPTFESIKATLPNGAITDPEIVGRFKEIRGKRYKMFKPTTKTQEGYVYVPVTE